jgi:release factor glutamine methyltransferase
MNDVGSWLRDQRDLPRLDCELLLGYRLGVSRSHIIAHAEQSLTAPELSALAADTKRLRDDVPLAYITGRREFWALGLSVTQDVLVPRPETETLVEQAIGKARTGDRILDLGTGCGAIAIALATSLEAELHASDHSEAALCIARSNAMRHHANIQFSRSDWFAELSGDFHLIVANPPYIAQDDPHLSALKHEPVAALISGPDGLDAIRSIVAKAPTYLVPQGWLLLEHGYDQAARICHLFAVAGFTAIETIQDLNRQDRVTLGQAR